MATTNYSLTTDESTALDAMLSSPPCSLLAARLSFAKAQKNIQPDMLNLIQRQFTDAQQFAYATILTSRIPPVAIPGGATISRQSIATVDTLVVQN